MRGYLVDGGTQRVEADRAVEEVELHAHIRGGGALRPLHEGAALAFFHAHIRGGGTLPPLHEGAALAFFLFWRSHSCLPSLLPGGKLGGGVRWRDSADGGMRRCDSAGGWLTARRN
jgi:hypothetical protein